MGKFLEKIIYQKYFNWFYAPMFYPHMGTVTAMCDQYSQ